MLLPLKAGSEGLLSVVLVSLLRGVSRLRLATVCLVELLQCLDRLVG